LNIARKDIVVHRHVCLDRWLNHADGTNEKAKEWLRKRKRDAETDSKRYQDIEEPPPQLFEMNSDLIKNLDAGIQVALLAYPIAPRIVERAEWWLPILHPPKIGEREPKRFNALGQSAGTDNQERDER
jgi:hypothetical protein